MCDFDGHDIKESYELEGEEKLMEIHNRILFEHKLKELIDNIYEAPSIINTPIDYIGIGNNTKGMPLQQAVNEAYKELKELRNERLDN